MPARVNDLAPRSPRILSTYSASSESSIKGGRFHKSVGFPETSFTFSQPNRASPHWLPYACTSADFTWGAILHTAKVPHISYMHMIRRSFETEEARVSRVKSGDATSRPNSVCCTEPNGLAPFQTCLTIRSPLRPQPPWANTCNGVRRKCATSGCSQRRSLRGSSTESGRSGIIAKTCGGIRRYRKADMSQSMSSMKGTYPLRRL